MEKKTVRTGIVGSGFSASFHFEALKKIYGTNVEVVGVHSIDKQGGNSYAQQRGIRFFSRLEYVVVDEAHSYRGVFGSHVANVLRRLRRICDYYGCNPRFICCSATIANPSEHAKNLAGVD